MFDRRPDFFREDIPPGRRVDATVKWFNASKGFGFVTLSDGTQDAFLPMATLRRAGYEDVREGALITCEISAGAKGPLVTSVLEPTMLLPLWANATGTASTSNRKVTEATATILGTTPSLNTPLPVITAAR